MVPGSVCTGAGWGATCAYVCNPGWRVQSGTTLARCNGAAWDSPPLVCRPPCPDLPAPQYAASCVQTLYSDDFNVDGSLNALASLHPVLQPLGNPSTNPPALAKWFQQDGMLQASGCAACTQDLAAVISSTQISGFDGAFSISASVMTDTRAGLVWRAQSRLTYMRFWFDAVLRFSAIERVVNGSVTTIATAYSNLLTAGTWHVVSVSVSGQAINVTVDGTQLLATIDRSLLVGSAGLYAQSAAFFDNLAFVTACTSSSAPAGGLGCHNLMSSNVCTFGCQPGLVASGPVSRTCVGTADLLSTSFSPDAQTSPLVCTLPAPTFLAPAAPLLVLENSPANTPIGDPLVAFSAVAAQFQVQFEVMAVYVTAFFQVPSFAASLIVGQALFYVDASSGQVMLRSGGQDVMNYEAANGYALTVRAFVPGFASAEAVLNVSVAVVNVDEARNTQALSVCAAGFFPVGAVCSPCAPGTYSLAGAQVCALCPAGVFGGAAGLTSAACSGACVGCPAGTAYPPSLSCAAADARAVPASLGLQLWPAMHPQNPQRVDLVVAPLAQCQQMTSVAACAAAATVAGADGVTRYVVGTAAAFNMEADETLTCT